MHPVALVESIKLRRIELFPVSIHKVHGPVHVPVMPRPVEHCVALPFEPALRIAWVPKKPSHKPLGTGATSGLPWPFTWEIDDHLVQITPPAQERECANPSVHLILESEVHAVGARAPAV